MKPAHILILTSSPLARNPRVVKEATTLGSEGHEVTVLGVRNHQPSVLLDTAIVTRAGCFRHEQIDLLDGPLALLRRARSRMARELVRRFSWQYPAALGPGPALLRAARARSFDLLIAHTEPALWAATRLLSPKRRVAADIEDWHSEDLIPSDRVSRPVHLLQQIERNLLQQSTYVTTTSESLATALHARYGGQRPKVITNSFPLPALAPRIPSSVTKENIPAFFWFSQTIGPGRGLEAFVTAWARVTRPSRLVLLGEVRGSYDHHLLSLLPDRLRPHLTFLPLVPPDELPAVIARHDIGLALEQAFIPNRDLTITNKILQYLGAGLAVVATPTSGQREVLSHAPQAGHILDNLNDPLTTAATLDTLLDNPESLRARKVAARKLAEDKYCWEREAPRLVALVQQALSS